MQKSRQCASCQKSDACHLLIKDWISKQVKEQLYSVGPSASWDGREGALLTISVMYLLFFLPLRQL